ncbi:GntR family transcriptional regulator [Guptibacillus algicola]|uniref:GntR family transcriptional regulator n=1 Tax=Guptibacillus algicola TaxID=225844 RepID=UPI001CD57D6B|nr:GntR family transcriptional regulator [Alkalihalobacillus algicola]MCA0986992.1 GntR family transcriptional regulator [Alkalihalobacillus algicola]
MTKRRNEELAYEKVKRAIMLKKLNPDQRVTEDWLSQELKMSRTPIRSAFKRLESEGLLTLIPHRGAFVCNPSDKELEDVFHLRVVIERYAAQLAIENMSDDDVDHMEALLKQELEAYESKDFEAFLQINCLIHSFPAKLSNNTFLLQEIERLNQWSDCYLILKDEFYTIPTEEAKSIPEHHAILEAFRNRNVDKMCDAIETHLLSTLDDLSERKSIFS